MSLIEPESIRLFLDCSKGRLLIYRKPKEKYFIELNILMMEAVTWILSYMLITHVQTQNFQKLLASK